MQSGDDLFKVTKWLMLIAGIWRLDLIGATKLWQQIYVIYCIIIQVAYNTCLISFIICFIQLWGVDNDKAIECLSMLTTVLVVVIKAALCQTERMSLLLRRAIDQVNSNYSIGDDYVKRIINSHSLYSTVLNVLVTVYSFSVGIHLNALGLIHYNKFKHGNDTEKLDKPLLILFWYPFDPNKYYGAVIFYQLATALLTDLVNSCVQCLINTIMIQMSAQLKILQHHFRSFILNGKSGRTLSKEEAYQNLKRFIRKHQDLINYIEHFNEALRYPLLIEYLISSLMLASILVQILTGKKVSFNVQYFLMLASQLFVMSWNANEISIQSQEIAAALYESLWYEQSTDTKKMLLIVLLRTKKPLSLDIGPFGPLTIQAAISRLKLAYSYVSLISSGSVG